MVKRPTMMDLAKAAGVSIATVDRVINRRLPVQGDTAQRVVKAAEEIGFHATALLKHRLHERPPRRFGFLLQKKYAFYEQLGSTLSAATRAASEIDGKASVEFVDELVPSNFVQRMQDMARKVDSLAMVAMDHPQINQAVEDLTAHGIPVFTLLSPINSPAVAGHLGLDSRKCGRIAGWLTCMSVQDPGKIGILVGSHRYLNHEISEIGFRGYLREHAPHLQLLEPIINLDDERIAHEAVTDMIASYPDLRAVYVAGGGQEGLIKALRENTGARRPVAICNELTEATRLALIDGIIDLTLCTPTGTLAHAAVTHMVHVTSGRPPAKPTALFSPEIIVRENL